MLGPAEAELSAADRASLVRAAAQFNDGRFFECHETLEELWSRTRGPARDFLQALIQVSVGHHHLERENRVGALRTFTKALARFEAYPCRYLGFDVSGERTRVENLRRALGSGEAGRPYPYPTWRFDEIPTANALTGGSP